MFISPRPVYLRALFPALAFVFVAGGLLTGCGGGGEDRQVAGAAVRSPLLIWGC